ncbi:MAG: hypothetical protein A3H70_02385 [Candidatus Komeilibacteria bacterium RIFCSPLOWO2_02_FULL_48_11]|uniref:DUF86 domain-containing protein n=1 Tax=Candidatus Komeilibacteria bacterium RIFCSPLOWO2_02_FULL_48_11 TaxID=1798553 RepID=A0A1G2BUP5_9BACT|nr:MAG: hypothetical protein A3H70_02385 [Candidatus Komeilibacteria bacterium RIFCSPLOWO2_02_FULL_48_11]
MNREYKLYLEDIIESIGYVEQDLEGVEKASFLNTRQIQDLAVHRLEIIGEAAGNVPDELKVKYPEIAWREISDMRNKLSHEYFGVKLEVVWETVKNDLPRLKEVVSKIINDLNEQ